MPQLTVIAKKPASAHQIASELNRNPVSVYRALKRFKVRHVLILNGFKYYDRSVITFLRLNMRARNVKNGNGKDGADLP